MFIALNELHKCSQYPCAKFDYSGLILHIYYFLIVNFKNIDIDIY